MTIKIRLDGEPAEVAEAVELLQEVFELAYNGKTTPNEASFTVRAYMEARPGSGEHEQVRKPAGSPDAWLAQSQAEREKRSADFAEGRAAMVNKMDQARRQQQKLWTTSASTNTTPSGGDNGG